MRKNILTTVNVNYKDFWDDKKIAEIVKNFIPPVSERLFVLFTEVPLQDILRRAIKEYKRNKKLEEFFKDFINE